MDERDHPQPADSAGAAPPEDQQLQHRVWVAQADELARLRDEVRAAAEREAIDVVTTARRKIRQVITDARRDLLVLTAQLHATLGPPGAPSHDETSLPAAALEHDPLELPQGHQPAGSPRDAERQAAVQAALDRAKAGLEALAQELEHIDVPVEISPQQVDSPPPPVHPVIAEEPSVRGVPWRPHADFIPSSQAPTGGTDRRRIAGLTLAAAILLTTGIVWFWPSRADRAEVGAEPTSTAAAIDVAPADPGATLSRPDPGAVVPAAPADPSRLSIVLTMERPAWIRAVVDGRGEPGRTYEPGETRRIEDARTVSLRVGDAGAVRISVNGAPAQTFGPAGAAVTREFSADDPPASTRTTDPGTPMSQAAPGADRPVAAAPAAAPPIDAPAATRTEPLPAPRVGSSPQGSTTAAETRGAGTPARAVGDDNIAAAGQEWLDAYHRQDARAMAAAAGDGTTIADERLPGERFAQGTPGVGRQFEAVTVEFAGDIAVYTARMIERRADGRATQEHVSRVAQIWTRRAGRWQLTDARIMSEARVGQLVR